ncbi:MAG: class I SAM-dependent methyltransferase [Chitinivibrionales bacterium]|nr:class I SAM-dependent methyltransferase [Chitinivibrionales bacterium]
MTPASNLLNNDKAGFLTILRRNKPIRNLLCHGITFGRCCACDRRTIFFQGGDSRRERYFCIFCKSIPRQRALMHVLEAYYPDWRQRCIYESSPNGASSAKLQRQCANFTTSHYFPDVKSGEESCGYRCENLENLTFGDNSFDMIITQDVFEHIIDPLSAFKEVARTLKPAGVHIFTIPWHFQKKTFVRVSRLPDGRLHHFAPEEYHGNPFDKKGSLVVTEWGADLCDIIYAQTAMTTTIVKINDKRLGTDALFNEVFISKKAE